MFALTCLCACTSSQHEKMDRALPAYSGMPAMSSANKERAVLIISPINGGRYKLTYEGTSQADIDAILFGKGSLPKPSMIEVKTPDGWKNWDTNRAEQSVPGYPPQGVGSPEP